MEARVEHVKDLLGTQCQGMKDLLEKVELEKVSEVDEAWAQRQTEIVTKYGYEIVSNQMHVWRALKTLTEGSSDARKVIVSVKQESGFRA